MASNRKRTKPSLGKNLVGLKKLGYGQSGRNVKRIRQILKGAEFKNRKLYICFDASTEGCVTHRAVWL